MTAPAMREALTGQAGGKKRHRQRRDEFQMVPDATFTSYYGRPVVRPAPWTEDIPAYLFLGGLAGGSSLLAAGANATGRPSLRRTSRLGALGAISASMYFLVHDLGKPSRFHHMLRVAKPTSPMSVGTWVLTAYGPMAGLAGVAELLPWLPRRLRNGLPGRLLGLAATPAGGVAALVAPAVASYTAVLLSNTATPSWHQAQHELPFVFVGSAAASAGGLGMLGAPVEEAGPARRMAVGGALLELAAEHKMERSMGLAAEPLHHGKAARYLKASKALTGFGAVVAAVLGGRSRTAAGIAGAALLAGSACTRFGVFEAGQESARDPKYTVVPQRERLNGRSGGTST
jgi:formate-dependent nitrite reductase membrane component NrfD